MNRKTPQNFRLLAVYKHSLLLIVILLSVIISSQSYGQSRRIDVGIVGAPSTSFLWGNPYGNTDRIFSVVGGVSFQYYLTKKYSILANISFEQKGGKDSMNVYSFADNYMGRLTRRENFNYITIPVMLHRFLGKRDRFFLTIGPYVSYLLKQVEVKTGYLNSRADRTEVNKRLDVGLSTGFGVSIPIHNRFIFSSEIRNNLGLMNISKDFDKNGSFNTNSTNLIFGLSYKITP